MIRFKQLEDKAQLLRCLTGLNLGAFNELLTGFTRAYQADLERRDVGRAVPRQRRRGAGRKGALPGIEDRLVFTLFYFRLYPVQMAHGSSMSSPTSATGRCSA